MKRIQNLMEGLGRKKKQTIALGIDCVALPVALYTALVLRLGTFNIDLAAFWPAFVVSGLVCVPVFIRLGLYRQVIRYMSNHAVKSVLAGAALAAVAVSSVAHLVPLQGFPRSVPIIFFMLVIIYVAGTRFSIRAWFQWSRNRGRLRQAVLIFGAGSAGMKLATLFAQAGEYEPVAFLDDDPSLQRRTVNGLAVYNRNDLPRLMEDTLVTQVFIAAPSATRDQRTDIIKFLEPFSLRVRIVPNLVELIEDGHSLAHVQDVAIEDLLYRDAVVPLNHLLERSSRDQCVMVTGAGGSIGSELVRQIASQAPKALVLFEQSEYALYLLTKEITETYPSLSVFSILGSVTDSALLQRTMRRFFVSAVYHAAAYKHVSLVENNVIQGLQNNTFGTLLTAQAAIECGVEKFILISTDKAVRTTNVMGASKRMAEMVLQALQQTQDETRFAIVRFGNVLGSSGSVVPLFEEQIARGGPVTVTHPAVTRYFMTIPEAAQLVLQAGSLAEGGDIFVLDMGQPVRIVDLARRMIRLRGHSVRDEAHPDGDIEIVYTGLKPGEKLYEELLLGTAVGGTEHRKIMRAEEAFIPWPELQSALSTLQQACVNYDYHAIRSIIEDLVEDATLEEQIGELAPRYPLVCLSSDAENLESAEIVLVVKSAYASE